MVHIYPNHRLSVSHVWSNSTNLKAVKSNKAEENHEEDTQGPGHQVLHQTPLPHPLPTVQAYC